MTQDTPDFSQFLVDEAAAAEEASPEQQAAVEALAARVSGWASGVEPFAIPEPSRRIVREGVVTKKGTESRIKSATQRRLVLLGDVLLVCKEERKERLQVKAAISLASATLRDSAYAEPAAENPKAALCFELATAERPFVFVCASPEDKLGWFDALRMAVLAQAEGAAVTDRGWRHRRVTGTPWAAALLGEYDVLERMVLAGAAEANSRDEEGCTPLHYAAMADHASSLNLLAVAEGNVNALDDYLNAPLHYAAAALAADSVGVLVRNGADCDARDAADHTPLALVALRCNGTPEALAKADECLASLAKFGGASADCADAACKTPLRGAAERQEAPMVRLLLKYGADPNDKDAALGRTPLHGAVAPPDAAAAYVSDDVVGALLDAGAWPNVCDTAGNSPAHLAMEGVRALEAAAGGDDEEAESRLVQLLTAVEAMVRRGARLGRAGGRPGLKEAHDAWARRHAPADMSRFRGRLPSQQDASEWVADGASRCCLLCQDEFTITRRRHHCRGCATLVCAHCSSKTLTLAADDGTTPKPVRVCDSCFNGVCAKLEQLESEDAAHHAALRREPSAAETAHARAREALLAGATPPEPPAAGASAAAGAHSAMAEAMDSLNERGQKLSQLEQRTQEMQNAAQDFNQMARQLREQQAKRKWWDF